MLNRKLFKTYLQTFAVVTVFFLCTGCVKNVDTATEAVTTAEASDPSDPSAVTSSDGSSDKPASGASGEPAYEASCEPASGASGEPATELPTIQSADELCLTSDDDSHYSFTYAGETYRAIFDTDTWKIIDSYRVTNTADMVIICQALSDLHPVPNADRTGYRTADDLAYEWLQHNIAYSLLPDDMKWKQNAKDVDLNPDDQGKNLINFFFERSMQEIP